MKNLQIKQRLITIAVFLAVSAFLGLLVLVSGIVPVAASSGHWEITRTILHFAKQRSVATHSSGIDVPPLNDPALILKGAGHFETGCVQCHGSPARPASPIAKSMTATPPSLNTIIEAREPQELFYVVKHGIKMTGMPAWSNQERDDEVWATVAFLLELPEMKPDEYLDMIGRTNQRGKTDLDISLAVLLESCHRCHGKDGLGRGTGAFPKLAGQTQGYLLQSMQAYADGKRHSGMMQPIAAVLNKEQIQSAAGYFANLGDELTAIPTDVWQPGESASDRSATQNDAIGRGETIAHNGIPKRNVPACVDCHGPSEILMADNYPRLAGQYKEYLVLQLRLFKSGRRGGTDSAGLMKPVIEGLDEDEFLDVAAYYASLAATE